MKRFNVRFKTLTRPPEQFDAHAVHLGQDWIEFLTHQELVRAYAADEVFDVASSEAPAEHKLSATQLTETAKQEAYQLDRLMAAASSAAKDLAGAVLAKRIRKWLDRLGPPSS